MSVHDLRRPRPVGASAPAASSPTGIPRQRLGAAVYRGTLALLAAAVVTNAGAVLAQSHGGLPVTEALAGAVVVQWTAHQLRRRRAGTAGLCHLRALTVVFGAHLCVALASVLWAAEPDAALAGVGTLATDMAIAGTLIVAVRDHRDVRWIILGLVAGAGAIALMVALQTATGAHDVSFGGFARASFAHIADDTDDVRVVGPFGDPNFFAQTTVSVLPLALTATRVWAGSTPRALVGVVSLALALATIVTFSRGALLALGVIGAATVVQLRTHKLVLAAAAVAVLTVVVALPSGYGARLTAVGDVVSPGGAAASRDPSLQGRASEMTAAARMFVDRPVGGIGFDGYPGLYLEYSPWIGLDRRRQAREAHSLYLEIAAETGIAGIGVLVVGLGVTRARVVRARRRLAAIGATADIALLDGLALAATAFLVTSVFLHGAYLRLLWLVLGLMLTAPWPVAIGRDR